METESIAQPDTWIGELDLVIGKDRADKSIVKKIYHQGGIKVQRPVYLDGGNTPCFYLLNPHGAFLDSDRYLLNVRLQEDARLTMTTQGSTLIYKSPHKEAYQEARFHLDEDSYFEYLPGAIIGYENARFYQKTIVHLSAGATFVYLDVITPGWAPDGEAFKYTQLRFQSEVYKGGELVVFDHIKLKPSEQEFDIMGYLEGYSHLGTFMVLGDNVDDELIDEIYNLLEEEEYDVKFGISRLSTPGFTVRILANMTQHIEWLAMKCRNYINQKWYGTTLGTLRKY